MGDNTKSVKAYYETDEFLALRDEWYEKAQASGFNDIEVIDEITHQPGHMLRGISMGDLGRSDARRRYVHESEVYYRMARAHIHEMPKGPRRHVWEMHAEGFSQREIHQALGARYGLKYGTVIRYIKDEQAQLKAQAREETGFDE